MKNPIMKTSLVISIIALGSACPAFAHADSDRDVRTWTDHYFEQIDTDHNGYITKDEFMNHAANKFDEIDANHDGYITKDEVISFKKKEMAEQRRYNKHHAVSGGSNRPDSSGDQADTNRDSKANSEDNNK